MPKSPFNLISLAKDFKREAVEIDEVFLACLSHKGVNGFNAQYGAGEDGCVVSLWDSWSRFLRGLYLCSCAAPSVGVSGVIYTPSRTLSENAALALLRREAQNKTNLVKFTRGEANWLNTSAATDFCRLLNLPNSGVITAALSASSIYDSTGLVIANPTSDVRQMRNYIAHKSLATRADIVRMGVSPSNPRTYLSARMPGGTRRFSDWASGLIAIAYAAVD